MRTKEKATLLLLLSISIKLINAQPIIIVLCGEQAATAPIILIDNQIQEVDVEDINEDTVVPIEEEIILADSDEIEEFAAKNNDIENLKVFLVDLRAEEEEDDMMINNKEEKYDTNNTETFNIDQDYNIGITDDQNGEKLDKVERLEMQEFPE